MSIYGFENVDKQKYVRAAVELFSAGTHYSINSLFCLKKSGNRDKFITGGSDMPLTILEEKLKTLPESCFQELYEFMEFLEYKSQKNGLDTAIAELEHGDYETYDSFGAFKAAMTE